jgi:hypothetical protein
MSLISFNQLNGSIVSDGNGNTTLGTLSSSNAISANANSANSNNTAVGVGALRTNAGGHNIALGLNALANNTGSNNVAIGENALCNYKSVANPVVQTGDSNIAIGNNALGNNLVGATTLIGQNNVAIGHNTDAGTQKSCIQLGNNAITKRDNEIGIGGIKTVVLSNSSIAGYLPVRLSTNPSQPCYIPLYTGSEVHNALSFNGVNNTVALASFPQLGASPITIETWCYFTTNSIRTVIGLNDLGGFGIDSAGKIELWWIFNNAAKWANTKSDSAVPLNQWVYIAIVVNDNGYIKMYINNNVVKTVSITSTVIDSSIRCTGISLAANAKFNTDYSSFLMSETRVWSIARTETQLKANYTKEVATTEAGLEIYYKFKQGTPNGNNAGLTTLVDSTGRYNGTLMNFALSGTTSNYVSGASLYGI